MRRRLRHSTFPGDFSSLLEEKDKNVLQELLSGLKKKNAEVCIDLAELQEKELEREKERGARLQNAMQALAEKEKERSSPDSSAFLQILNTLRQGLEELRSYQQSNELSPNDVRELSSIADEWKRLLDSVS